MMISFSTADPTSLATTTLASWPALNFPTSYLLLLGMGLFFFQWCLRKPQGSRHISLHAGESKQEHQAPVNVVITGAAQGIGKLLCQRILDEASIGAVRVLLLDVNEELGMNCRHELVESLRARTTANTKDSDMAKFVHFCPVDLANPKQVELCFAKLRSLYGPIHILVNNAARVLGRSVRDLSVEQVQATMQVNFMACVQLTKLFLDQPEIDTSEDLDFSVVNVNSIAGYCSCQRTADYSASKFALRSFMDTLRQELILEGNRVKLINTYPYYIDTGLFEGFSPRLCWVLPALRPAAVAQRIHRAILSGEEEVFIYSFLWYLQWILEALPQNFRYWIIHVFVGNGMHGFRGRAEHGETKSHSIRKTGKAGLGIGPQ